VALAFAACVFSRKVPSSVYAGVGTAEEASRIDIMIDEALLGRENGWPRRTEHRNAAPRNSTDVSPNAVSELHF
jgi:hypothetical protein